MENDSLWWVTVAFITFQLSKDMDPAPQEVALLMVIVLLLTAHEVNWSQMQSFIDTFIFTF